MFKLHYWRLSGALRFWLDRPASEVDNPVTSDTTGSLPTGGLAGGVGVMMSGAGFYCGWLSAMP